MSSMLIDRSQNSLVRQHHLRVSVVHRRPTADTATRPGRGKPRLGPLLNETTLELRKCREDVEYEFTGRRRRVDHPIRG
jgi:hypothetical protein